MKNITYNYHKKFCLLCEECNCLTEQSASVFFEGAEIPPDFYKEFTNEYYCKNCGKFTCQFDIERNISKSVRLLRLHGYETRYSCEGHSKLIFTKNEYTHDTSYPYICFKDNKDLPDRFLDLVYSYGWKMEKFNNGLWRLSDNTIDFDDEKFKENPQEYVECLNKAFKSQDKRLFKALLEVFIEE